MPSICRSKWSSLCFDFFIRQENRERSVFHILQSSQKIIFLSTSSRITVASAPILIAWLNLLTKSTSRFYRRRGWNELLFIPIYWFPSAFLRYCCALVLAGSRLSLRRIRAFFTTRWLFAFAHQWNNVYQFLDLNDGRLSTYDFVRLPISSGAADSPALNYSGPWYSCRYQWKTSMTFYLLGNWHSHDISDFAISCTGSDNKFGRFLDSTSHRFLRYLNFAIIVVW